MPRRRESKRPASGAAATPEDLMQYYLRNREHFEQRTDADIERSCASKDAYPTEAHARAIAAMHKAVDSAVKQGKKISMPLAKSPLLPRAVVQMIGAGEESGKLGEVLDQVSEFYAKELKTVIKSVTAMIEPLMIVIMGGMVGFIAMSIILPIFKLSQLVK